MPDVKLLDDTWSWRELPVIIEAVRGVDLEPVAGIRLGEVAQATGLSIDDVYRAAKALEADGLVDLVEYAGPSHATRIRWVSGEARQLAGAWPTPQTALDRMIDALEAIAANTDDPEERTRAKRFADWLRTGATTVGLSVASAAITGQIS